MFNGVIGVWFINLDSLNVIGGVEFKFLDGDWGDVDGIVNGLVVINGYVGCIILGLISNNNWVFWVFINVDG